ncbi:MAG TPA: chromosomal replication initiator protein DnaA [Planctomycetota bacterium]|nr:chromosomal replication initiator protein DnaA [Planctomycetota bacterium]
MSSDQLVWNSILTEAESRVRKQQFNTWFPNIRFVDLSNHQLHLRVPNAFFRDWLQTHYADVIRDSAKLVTGDTVEVLFTLQPEEALPPLALPMEPARPAISTRASREPNPDREPRRPASLDAMQLHDEYIFSNFVVGPCNNLAHAAALAVAEAPSQAYNPLFMHGSVGLGKTHLIQAIAHTLLEKNPRPRILYLSCESFMNQFISAVRHGDIENFRFRYRHVDVLLIDDIHFLSKGDRTQEEFFHTFNALYNAQKQIILTCDSPPKEIPTIQERLVSRFKWGLVTKLSPPCFETRMAIIHKKAQMRGCEFPEDVVRYIAESVPGNIREIEGAIIKVINYSDVMRKRIDLSVCKAALADSLDRERGTISIEDTQNAVVKHFKIKLSDLQSKRRSKAIAHPRQVCMYLARKLTNYSLEQIGGYFGGRDHTTVMHACDKIEGQLRSDTFLSATVEKITEELRKNSGKQ